MTEKQSSSNIW